MVTSSEKTVNETWVVEDLASEESFSFDSLKAACAYRGRFPHETQKTLRIYHHVIVSTRDYLHVD